MNTPTLSNVFEHSRLDGRDSPLFSLEDIEKTASLAAADAVDDTRTLVNSLVANASDQLLDISLTDILLGAWTKIQSIQEYATGEKLASDEVHEFKLTEHKVTSKHAPKIELYVYENKVNEVVLDVSITLLIAKTTLLIRKGRIRELRVSGCQVAGKISCHGQKLVEKKSGELEFPQSVTFGNDGIEIPPPLKLQGA